MWKQRAINKFKSSKVTLAEFDFSQSPTVCNYQNVTTTDYYRKGKPYKLLGNPGTSSIEMPFSIADSDIPQGYKMTDISSIDIVLNHCRTSSNGIIDIMLNGNFLIEEYREACRPFGVQTFNYPIGRFKGGENLLKIRLHPRSPAVYWLSDAKIVAHMDGITRTENF